MTKEQKRTHLKKLVEALKELYPDAACSLESEGDPFKLLVMGMLSAQCTDERVNLVSKELFAVYKNVNEMADAPQERIEALVRPCGLYKTKAKHIKETAIRIRDYYEAQVPCEMEDLLTLPGVGRKIANLVRGDVFQLPAVVTDTHCIRICGRFGLYPATLKEPAKIESILWDLIDPLESSDFCHRLVLFGRATCSARAPKCNDCPIKKKGLCKGLENG